MGKMKQVEVNGKEIMLVNVEGKIYAISDRCGHMTARLSTGTLDKNVMTCPQHFSRFDAITGKMVTGPVEITGSANILEKCPKKSRRLYHDWSNASD